MMQVFLKITCSPGKGASAKAKLIEGEPQLFGGNFAFYSRVVPSRFYF